MSFNVIRENKILAKISEFAVLFIEYACSQSVIMYCLFVCFVALRPKSTAMVIAGRSVHLTTLFPGQA